MKLTTSLSMIATAGLTAAAAADITGAYVVSYEVTAADFDGSDVSVYVQDLYLASNDAWEGTTGSGDTVLNVFNLIQGDDAATSYFQSFTGTGWQPTNLGGPFDTPALRLADSFVTIGGFEQGVLYPEQSPGAGSGTGLDPNFGGNGTQIPAANAGWYNGSPPSLNGATGEVAGAGTIEGSDFGVLIGRFSTGTFASLEGSTLEVTWNQGLGSPGNQELFTVVPAPGALALLGLAGVAGRRRRC